MKTLSTAFCCLFSLSAFCQQKVKAAVAAKYVCDSVSICGKVSGGRYLDKSKRQLTMLNLDGNYPNNAFTAMIFSEARALFKNTPETYYKDSSTCITGKVALYNSKPQIVVINPNQITVH